MIASTSDEVLEADGAIRAVVVRLARPAGEGGTVIERAAIVAEGANAHAIEAWIVDHGGRPEAIAAASAGAGLHGARGSTRSSSPLRYLLPAGALAKKETR
jgi:hypothetical protein